MDLETCFNDEEKAALAVLTGAGFVPLTELRVEDGQELAARRPTFRHAGRHALCLCLKTLPQAPAAAPKKRSGKKG